MRPRAAKGRPCEAKTEQTAPGGAAAEKVFSFSPLPPPPKRHYDNYNNRDNNINIDYYIYCYCYYYGGLIARECATKGGRSLRGEGRFAAFGDFLVPFASLQKELAAAAAKPLLRLGDVPPAGGLLSREGK